jgi:hypothetical protein
MWKPNQPIRVVAKTNNDIFELSVRNSDCAISADKQAQLLLLFKRGDGSSDSECLGPGLYVCAEIAKTHATFRPSMSPLTARRCLIPHAGSMKKLKIKSRRVGVLSPRAAQAALRRDAATEALARQDHTPSA